MNRLFEMVYILLEKENITARELAEYFEVSVRTVYRDIEVLSQSGIPIYANKGHGGGIGLMPDFVLNKSVLSDNEKREILWALQGMSAVKAAENSKTIAKLRSLFGVKEAVWLEVDFSDWGDRKQSLFHELKEAITDNQVMEFDYYDSKGKRSRRQVEPVKLCFKEKAWYLKAYCRKAQGIRMFKLTRIRNMVALAQTFSRDLLENREGGVTYENGEKMTEQTMKQLCMVTIKLQIDRSEAYRVYDEFDDCQVIKREDGNYLVTMTIPENEWLYGYILSYGERAKVLEPERVKAILKDKIIKMNRNYE